MPANISPYTEQTTYHSPVSEGLPQAVRRPVSAPQAGAAPSGIEQGGGDEHQAGGVILQLNLPGAGDSGKTVKLYGPDGMPANPQQIKAAKTRMEDQSQPCQTCAERKYQDGSSDMGVSFKAATNISPEAAGALVRAHEQEHVTNAQAEAREKNLNVMSTVTIHTDICPECKRVYVSGGTTNTRMSSKPSNPMDAYSKQINKLIGMLMNGSA